MCSPWQITASPCNYVQISRKLTIVPEELRRPILDGNAAKSLVAGLTNDLESVQTACKDALLDLVQHGPFVCCFVTRNGSLIPLVT